MFRTHRTTTTVGTARGRSRLTAAAAVAAGLALAGCGTTEDTSSGGGGGGGGDASACEPATLAYLGATTGDYGALGQNMVGGIKLALDEYNKDNADCKVEVKVYDSQGNPEKATPLATQIVGEESLVGLVGPGFSGESLATGKTFAEAGLPVISPSATNVTITDQGWSNWHRVIGNDEAQGAADAKYMTETAGAKKVFVADDGSDYGKGLADFVRDTLGDTVVDNDTVSTGQTDFSATVTKVKASDADAFFYGGYYAEAGLLAKQLRQAGFKGLFMSGDGSEDPQFVKAAGAQAAEGAVLSAPAGPAPADFNEKYKAVNGSDAGLYSTQAYDAANIFLAGIDDGASTNEEMNSFVSGYTGTGASGPIAFDDKGDITESTIYAYLVKNGKLDTENPAPIK